MKPESVDDGSLEKLAEKAADKLILDFWDEFQLGQFAPEEIKAIGENLESSFLSALSEATAVREAEIVAMKAFAVTQDKIIKAAAEAFIALEEEIEGLKKANRGLYRESNQRLEKIKELESANATTRSPRDE